MNRQVLSYDLGTAKRWGLLAAEVRCQSNYRGLGISLRCHTRPLKCGNTQNRLDALLFQNYCYSKENRKCSQGEYDSGWIMHTSLEPEPLRVGDGDRQLPLQLVLVLVVRQNNLG